MQGIYLVTDRALCGSRTVEQVVAAAVRGGVRAVQLREKELNTRAFVERARRVHAVTSAAGVPLLINDRVDVALAAGADGVHLGQSDMDYAAARRLMGPDALIGVSVESLEQLAAAEATDADYFGISPLCLTSTKKELTQAWGMAGLRRAREQTARCLVAIGGIDAGNAGAVRCAGADALAVVSAICAAEDPENATRQLCAAFAAGAETRPAHSIAALQPESALLG